MKNTEFKLNRRGLFAGMVGLSGLLALSACGKDEPEPAPEPTPSPEVADPMDEKFEEIEGTDSYDEAGLVFGDNNSVKHITVALDYASPESTEFFNTHYETMREFYVEDDRKLEIVLITPPDVDGIPQLNSYSASTTAMGILVHTEDSEKFWDYSQTVFNREEKTITQDELVQIGSDFGVDADTALMGMDATRMLVDRMTSDVEMLVGGFDSPHIFVSGSLWTGDVKNSDEVNEVFSSIGE